MPMTDHNRRVLLASGIVAAGVYWWTTRQALTAATRKAIAAPRLPLFPSTSRPAARPNVPSSTSGNPLGDLLKNLLKGVGGGSGGGSGFSGGVGAPSQNSQINPAGDRRGSNVVLNPGAPGYVSPWGTLDTPLGSNYGPEGIFVDYQAQAEALGSQLANFGPSQEGQDLLAAAYADDSYINPAGDPLASYGLFPTGDDGFGAPIIGTIGELAPDLGSGDSQGFLADAYASTDDGGMFGGDNPTLWGGSPNDSGFDDGFLSTDTGLWQFGAPEPTDLGGVDPNNFFGSEPVIDSWAGNADYGYDYDPNVNYDYYGDTGGYNGAPDDWPDGFAWYQ